MQALPALGSTGGTCLVHRPAFRLPSSQREADSDLGPKRDGDGLQPPTQT